MNSGATSERIYDALKGRILNRQFAPGERLDPARLGDELFSSVTPVRDALHQLVGEGLVETRTSDGFHVPTLDSPALQDLYAWNNDVLQLALKDRGVKTARHGEHHPLEIREPLPVATLFAQIAASSRNAEHLRAILALNDRLAAARIAELAVLTDTAKEIMALTSLFLADEQLRSFRRCLLAYHRRRRQAAAQIIRALYRGA